ncbi:hypothetical protein E4U55_006646 [Claviceps digitariae]|nr:hypothetical protein E4U55_006646 [Claviceps digitariae]
MKFSSTITFLAAIAGTYSLVIEKRTTPVRKVILDMAEAVGDLHEVTRTLDGDIDPLVRTSDRLIEVINMGQRTADTCDPLSLSDSLSLVNPTKVLERKSKQLITMLKMRIDEVRAARACGTTREKVNSIMALSTKLVDTIINKMASPMARSTAKQMTADMKKKFKLVETTFAENNCPI